MSNATEIVSRFVEEVLNRKNAEAIKDLVAPDYVRHDSVNAENGPDAVRSSLEKRVSAGHEFKFKIENLVAEGDMVATRLSATGRADGKDHSGSGAAFLRIANGKIAEVWSYWDHPKG